jgi:hypothetical protein
MAEHCRSAADRHIARMGRPLGFRNSLRLARKGRPPLVHVPLQKEYLVKLAAMAGARGIASSELARRILITALKDGLVAAILDD